MPVTEWNRRREVGTAQCPNGVATWCVAPSAAICSTMKLVEKPDAGKRHLLLRARTRAGDIPDGKRGTHIMVYYVSKAFWLIAAPTSALVLISAIAALWAVLGNSKCAAWLAAAAACGLVIGAFTPIGVALLLPLEQRFIAFSPLDSQAPPDGIIVLAGAGDAGIDAVSALSREYPKARLTFSGYRATALKRFANLGGDPVRAQVESRPRMHCTPPRCSNQSPVKGGCWSR